MQRSKTDEKMQQEGKVCRKKIEEERRKNGHEIITSGKNCNNNYEELQSAERTTMEGRIIEKRC